MKDTSREFGDALANALGEGPGRRALAAQRATLLLRWSAQQARPRRAPWIGAGLGVAAVCAALLFTLWRPTPEVAPVTWRGAPIAEHELLHVEDVPGRLEFANGSHIELQAETSAALGRREGRVELSLQRGRLDADVQREPGTEWFVAAGPYRVRVIGTRFSVAWHPDAEAFAVEVSRGEVRVLGEELPAEGVAVRAGARWERSGPAVAHSDAASPLEDALVTDSAPSEEEPRVEEGSAEGAAEGSAAPVAKASVGSPSSKEGAPSSTKPPAWHALTAEGRYGEALAAVSAAEFDEMLARAPAGDLLELGNTARFAGHPDRARRAYTSLRSRYPRAAEARLAAFALARRAADVDRDPSRAIHWLRVFLGESPSGDLAASARARLMDTLASQGRQKEVAEVARDYLRHHPEGPHAGIARGLLGSSP